MLDTFSYWLNIVGVATQVYPLLTAQVNVDLPALEATRQIRAKENAMVIMVDAQGQAYLDDKSGKGRTAVSDERWQTRVAEEIVLHPQRHVLVRADRNINLVRLMQVVTQAKAAGAEHVHFQPTGVAEGAAQ